MRTAGIQRSDSFSESGGHFDRYRPRILCVIDTIGLGGGAEQLIASLLPALQARGVDTELAALYPWEPDLGTALEAEGIRVYRFDATGWRNSLRTYFELRRLVGTRDYDVIWGNLRFANVYIRAASLGIKSLKTVVTFHSVRQVPNGRTRLRTRVSTAIEKLFLTGADAMVAVSKVAAASYEKLFRWRGIDVIYNGVSTISAPIQQTSAIRRELRHRYGVSESDFLFVVPARYIPAKGHVYLLEAMRHLIDTRGWCPTVLMFGEGPLRTSLESEARRLGIVSFIRFNNPIPHAALLSLVQSADGVVLPSLSEGFGIAAAESMMLGIPVILTRIDSFMEIVGDADCALMVPTADSFALSDAIWHLAKNPAEAHSRAGRARAHITDNFNMSVTADHWAALFRRLCRSEREGLCPANR